MRAKSLIAIDRIASLAADPIAWHRPSWRATTDNKVRESGIEREREGIPVRMAIRVPTVSIIGLRRDFARDVNFTARNPNGENIRQLAYRR